MAPDPAEGWLSYATRWPGRCCDPASAPGHTSAQWDGALCFLQLLQVLFDAERTCLPFDFWLDFEFCTEEELSHSGVAEEYRRFCYRFREEYIYEMLRLSREVTSFRTLEHIAGVHYVSMRVARAFCASGGLIDLGLISGAALGHDLGKFGASRGTGALPALLLHRPVVHPPGTNGPGPHRGQPLRLGFGDREPVLRSP